MKDIEMMFSLHKLNIFHHFSEIKTNSYDWNWLKKVFNKIQKSGLRYTFFSLVFFMLHSSCNASLEIRYDFISPWHWYSYNESKLLTWKKESPMKIVSVEKDRQTQRKKRECSNIKDFFIRDTNELKWKNELMTVRDYTL